LNIKIFNICLLIGWLMVTIGGMILNVGAGLCIGGALLIGLTIIMSKIGGLFVQKDNP
jgi:drug/metabolite transporter (DMT)-like permease